MSDMIVGIDNGISGGMCVMSRDGGKIIGIAPMPVIRQKNRNEVWVNSVLDWLDYATNDNVHKCHFVIEEPNNSRNASTAYSVASSFHSLRGMIQAKAWYWSRITPQSWQKAMLGKFPKGESKNYALAKANELWPNETFHATARSKKHHDGLIDAALIAEYGRKFLLK